MGVSLPLPAYKHSALDSPWDPSSYFIAPPHPTPPTPQWEKTGCKSKDLHNSFW